MILSRIRSSEGPRVSAMRVYHAHVYVHNYSGKQLFLARLRFQAPVKERQKCLIASRVMSFLFAVEKCTCCLLSCERRERRDQQYVDQMCDICNRSPDKFTLSDVLRNVRLKTNVIWFQLNSRIHYPIDVTGQQIIIDRTNSVCTQHG